MTRLAKTLRWPPALGVGLTFIADSAFATELCHNIGGPRDLGANCEANGTCSYVTDTGETIILGPNQYFGIVIGEPLDLPSSTNVKARAAHIAHGDGFVIATFDPPLHLASEIGPHIKSNVECVATRLDTTQPPEPGN